MKKIIYFIISIIICISFFGCSKQAEITYIENSEYQIKENKSLTDFTNLTKINLSNSESIADIDYTFKLLTVKDNNNLYGIKDSSNKFIYPVIYDSVIREYGLYILSKDGEISVYDPLYGIIKTFQNGEVKILYDKVIAYFEPDSYKIFIYYLDNDTVFEIYDNKKSKENIYNYGKYLVYKNQEFNEFQEYDFKGVNQFKLPCRAARELVADELCQTS
jgi:hypothetical protein